jgi:hypothetical protein
VGAAALKGGRLVTRRDLPAGFARGMLAGAGAAFGSTLLSLRLIRMLERGRSLRPYAAYRALLALVVLAGLRRRSRAPIDAPERAPVGASPQVRATTGGQAAPVQ